MSKQDFLNNFRIARNLFVHPRVTMDSSHLEPHELEQKLARAAIWLTPRSVQGFNASDFPELLPRHVSFSQIDFANRPVSGALVSAFCE